MSKTRSSKGVEGKGSFAPLAVTEQAILAAAFLFKYINIYIMIMMNKKIIKILK